MITNIGLHDGRLKDSEMFGINKSINHINAVLWAKHHIVFPLADYIGSDIVLSSNIDVFLKGL